MTSQSEKRYAGDVTGTRKQPKKVKSLVDHLELGRRIRAARILAGYESMGELTRTITERTGLAVSDRTMYAVERGEQNVAWELLIAVALVLEPPGGMRFFYPSVAPEHVGRLTDMLEETMSQGVKRAAEHAYLIGEAGAS